MGQKKKQKKPSKDTILISNPPRPFSCGGFCFEIFPLLDRYYIMGIYS